MPVVNGKNCYPYGVGSKQKSRNAFKTFFKHVITYFGQASSYNTNKKLNTYSCLDYAINRCLSGQGWSDVISAFNKAVTNSSNHDLFVVDYCNYPIPRLRPVYVQELSGGKVIAKRTDEMGSLGPWVTQSAWITDVKKTSAKTDAQISSIIKNMTFVSANKTKVTFRSNNGSLSSADKNTITLIAKYFDGIENNMKSVFGYTIKSGIELVINMVNGASNAITTNEANSDKTIKNVKINMFNPNADGALTIENKYKYLLTFQHELIHAMLFSYKKYKCPIKRWFSEGLAEQIRGKQNINFTAILEKVSAHKTNNKMSSYWDTRLGYEIDQSYNDLYDDDETSIEDDSNHFPYTVGYLFFKFLGNYISRGGKI